MIIEERTYTLFAEARLDEFLSIYETEGLVVQKPILKGFLGYFTSVFGQQNQVVHWWCYPGLDERQRRRERLHQDPQWLAVLPKLRPMLQDMHVRILSPVSFSPIASVPVGSDDPDTAFGAVRD